MPKFVSFRIYQQMTAHLVGFGLSVNFGVSASEVFHSPVRSDPTHLHKFMGDFSKGHKKSSHPKYGSQEVELEIPVNCGACIVDCIRHTKMRHK